MLCCDTARDIRVAWLAYLACLLSHVLRAYCNFESKQAISISLFGRRPNNNVFPMRINGVCVAVQFYILGLNFLHLLGHWAGGGGGGGDKGIWRMVRTSEKILATPS